MATPCSVNALGMTEECFREWNRSQFVTSSSFSLGSNLCISHAIGKSIITCHVGQVVSYIKENHPDL